jgi:hypothetical protein
VSQDYWNGWKEKAEKVMIKKALAAGITIDHPD